MNPTKKYRFADLYKGRHGISGTPLDSTGIRETYICDMDVISKKSEHGRDDRNSIRLINLLKKHGYYVSVDGSTVYQITDDNCIETRYEDFHRILSKFTIIADIVPRTREKIKDADGNEKKVAIAIEFEKDFQDIEGFDANYKYVACSITVNFKNQIAAKIFSYLDEIKGVSQTSFFSDGVTNAALDANEGVNKETAMYMRPVKHFASEMKKLKDLDGERHRANVMDALEALFGFIPDFTNDSASNDGLLFMVMSVLARDKLGAVPFFCISSETKFSQGVGKTHIARQLNTLIGLDPGNCMLNLKTNSSFDLSQFKRDWNNALANESNRIIAIDNFISGKEENKIASIPHLSSFGTSGAKKISVTLTGRGGSKEVDGCRNLILNGNGLTLNEEWARRTLFFKIKDENRLYSGEYLEPHEDKKRAGILAAFLQAFRFFKENVEKGKRDDISVFIDPMYASFTDTFRKLIPFVRWVVGDEALVSFRKGKGLFVIDEQSNMDIILENFRHQWWKAFGDKPVSASQVIENEAVKNLCVMIKGGEEMNLQKIGRLLVKLSQKANIAISLNSHTKANNYRMVQEPLVLARQEAIEPTLVPVEVLDEPVGEVPPMETNQGFLASIDKISSLMTDLHGFSNKKINKDFEDALSFFEDSG